ncbi:MAG: DUF1576 domain-containing protein [Oscillospiraceae bacterium]|nr:DUF1576 domain-containing protein [Oscillospiraceae bacterium]MDE6934139.1 DUF1576 domain-containing protein [Oscillospiraceae bacterium]
MANQKTDSVKIIRFFLMASSAAFLIAAGLAPDRGEMITGLARILMSPAQLTKDYFAVGSVSGAFLNVSLVGFVCAAMTCLPGAAVNGLTVAAYFLTTGFSFWGINFLNMWPFFLGVMLHALARKEPFPKYVNLAMFATALCPLASELLLRYPNDAEVHGVTLTGVALMLVVGGLIGFLTPAMAAHSPSVHKGYDLYSAALPGVLLGLMAVAVLYKSLGNTVPEIAATLDGSHPGVVWSFCIIFFGLCVLAGFWLNGKSFKGYGALLKDTGHKADFTAKYGPGLAIMNVGVYGLMILAYYIFVNAIQGDALAGFNGVTIGIVFCMVCFGANGAHPGNVWPIMVGYVAFSYAATLGFGGVFPVNAQAIMVGLCFASGLAPIAGDYGWWAGILAGGMHYLLVTSIPPIHGGFSLYNGGFTALVIAIILVPQLETFCKNREQRLNAKNHASKQ